MESLNESIRRANTATNRPAPNSRPAAPLARAFMIENVVSFRPDTPIERAIDVLVQRGFSGAPVIDETGTVIGVLSELDCMKLVADNHFHQEGAAIQTTVEHLMTRNVLSIEPDTDLFAVAHKFITTGVRRLPVLDHGKLVGLVSRRDLLRAIRDFVR